VPVELRFDVVSKAHKELMHLGIDSSLRVMLIGVLIAGIIKHIAENNLDFYILYIRVNLRSKS
jgi:hypothetical protein